MAAPNIDLTLYSNTLCPYVHRALTTLHELELPFHSIPIDLEVPRPASYLAVNPRGTVPALTFTSPDYNNGKEVIVNESLVIIYFLTDLFPNHLIPAAGSGVAAAADRARIYFFIDTWGNKIQPLLAKSVFAISEGEEAVKAAVEGLFAGLEKEIEPLLVKRETDGAGPFLGGKDRFTLAEIAVAPFLLRAFSHASAGLLPEGFKDRLLALPNVGKWVQEVLKNPNLLKDFNETQFVEGTKRRLQKIQDGTFKPKV